MNYQTFRSCLSRYACFSVEQAAAAFPGFSRANFGEWIRQGYLVRLRRGWYAFADAADIPGICDYFAGRIYAPSYLSCESVMSRCGLIPESVVQITSVTSLKTAAFSNGFGEFSYRTVKPELMFGYDVQTAGGGLPFHVASPAKALCDFLYLNPRYSSREELEGLRLDEDVMDDLLRDGSLETAARRFSSKSLFAKIETLKEMFAP